MMLPIIVMNAHWGTFRLLVSIVREVTRWHYRHPSAASAPMAAQRGITEAIQVRQLAGSDQWIATSGSDGATVYGLEVTGAVAQGCDCLAGLNGDGV